MDDGRARHLGWVISKDTSEYITDVTWIFVVFLSLFAMTLVTLQVIST